MNAPLLITATVVAIGAASIATSARANPVCDLGASLVESGVVLRHAGFSQQSVANIQSSIISRAISESGVAYADAQEAAAISGAIATYVLQAVYSFPLDASLPGDMQAFVAAQAFHEGCME